MGIDHQHISRFFAGVLLALALCAAALAQTPITFRYFYDDLGQLVKVADSAGNVIEYVYDAVGNILEIKRSSVAPGSLAIFNFTPKQGGPGTAVTIQGQGFSPTSSGNGVSFDGAAAAVVLSSTTELVVTVPAGATTGPISVSVGGATAVSSRIFTVIAAPAITSVNPRFALLGSTIASFNVTGFNLAGSSFSFIPALSPPGVTVGSASIDASGTSATLSLTIGSTPGSFVLVATNSVGSSSAFGSDANTLRVLDNNSAGFALAGPVSVLHLGTVPTRVTSTGVSVSRTSGTIPVLAQPVSVQHSPASTEQFLGTAISVATGPVISSISPNQFTRGSSAMVTIQGTNLTGTNSMLFIDSSGNMDSGIAVSSLVVAADGRSLTAAFSVASNSTLGRHTVVLITPTRRSPNSDSGVNTIAIQ